MTKQQGMINSHVELLSDTVYEPLVEKEEKTALIYVFYPEEAKVGVKTMKTYTNQMKSENVFRAILVIQQSLTPFARSCQAEISSKFQLEEIELLVNIKEHVLVLEHQVLTTEEKKTLLDRYTVKETQINTEDLDDSVINYYFRDVSSKLVVHRYLQVLCPTFFFCILLLFLKSATIVGDVYVHPSAKIHSSVKVVILTGIVFAAIFIVIIIYAWHKGLIGRSGITRRT